MPRPALPVALATGLALSGLTAAAPPALAVSPDVVISQVYGGGGNSGAAYQNDFVELFNPTDAPVSVDGWSVQYASAAGSSWSVTPLGGAVPPGGHYLVQLAAGTGSAPALPTPDATGSANLSGSSGKVALVPSTTALSCGTATSRCLPESYRDLVGYGSATDFEGAAAPGLTNSTAALRTGADTDSNAADFSAAAPAPRNSGSGTPPPPPPPPAGDPCAVADPVRIPAVQGSTGTSPYAGQTVTTRGVVVGDTPGLSGFFLQDPAGDGDPATSDGVFVYAPSGSSAALDVAVGDEVAVTGTVEEFGGLTEITDLTAAQECGTLALPAPTTYELPEPVQGDLERVEGMYVTIPTTLTVQQNYFLGRYGQLTLASGGRRHQPTNLFPPGSPEARALAEDNARSFLVLDDGSSQQNPATVPYLDAQGTRRAGDTVQGLTGVLDVGPTSSSAVRDVRLHPTAEPAFTSSGRPAAPEEVGGSLRVASFNVLNYFTTLDTPGPQGDPEPRGANTPEEFARQKAKIVAALQGLDADVVGLVELQNGTAAPQDLVDALNTAGGAPGRWAVVPDPAAGVGTDAIKVGQIYRTDRVERVGESVSPVDQSAFDGLGRPPVAQAYRQLQTGQVSSVVVNHFKSKGSCPSSGPDADQGDGQGCWNPTRVAQAEALADLVEQLGVTDPDVLVVGDLNAYGEEDPVRLLEDRGLVDLLERELGRTAYSYVFDGASGRLDHALATPSLAAQVTGATEWHINADEPSVLDYNTEFKPDDRYAPTPYRSSDHDPVLVGLALREPAPTLSVGDAQVTEGGELRFPVTLSRASSAPTTVRVDTSDRGATASDYVPRRTRITIPAGQTGATVAVRTTADRVDELDETLALTLSAPGGATLADAEATGTVVDDDTARVTVTGGTVREGAPGARPRLVWTLRLSTPSSRDVAVDVRTADGTARAACDYTAARGRMVVRAGATSATFAVTVLGDRRPEADETVQLLLSGRPGLPGAVVGRVTDDDPGRDRTGC